MFTSILGGISLLKGPLGKVAAGLGVISMVVFLSFQWGKSAANSKHARESAKLTRQWAEKTRVAEAQAYERGLQAAQIEANNDKALDQVVREAESEVGADDLCLSENTLERIRQIQ